MARSRAERRKRRQHYRIHRRTRPGAAPGTVVLDPRAHATVIDLFGYGPDGYVEEKAVTPERVVRCLTEWPVTWVNVEGLGDAGTLHRLAEIFSLHPLVREDVVNVHQRAKVEQYGDQLFIITRMVTLNEEIESEQLGIVLGANFVATFQEVPGDVLDPVRERIRGAGQIRRLGPDYLAYALVDAVVDHYFPVLEKYGERIEALEEEVVHSTDNAVLERIHQTKHDLFALRRAIWPQRDALAELVREPFALIAPATRVYIRDCYDHAVQVIDLLETYRETAGALLEIHVSVLSNRLNEVMKVLAVFSAIFSPLMVITGIYGMNFDPASSPWNMPELRWAYGYPFALVLMGAVAALTFGYIYRKGLDRPSVTRAAIRRETRSALRPRLRRCGGRLRAAHRRQATQPGGGAARAQHERDRERQAERLLDDRAAPLRSPHSLRRRPGGRDRAAPPAGAGRNRAGRKSCSRSRSCPIIHAENGGGRPYFLASALYAYALIFSEVDGNDTLSDLDPRKRWAANLYNAALAAGVHAPRLHGGRLRVGDLRPALRADHDHGE